MVYYAVIYIGTLHSKLFTVLIELNISLIILIY